MQDFVARVNSFDWFHSIDLGNGVVTKGRKSLKDIEQEQARFFDIINLEGTTVLDIGAWNGAHSFGAKSRGASRVLATDHFTWNNHYWRGRESFDIANSSLGLGIDALDIDVPNISPETVGVFDVVLFLGVLYHLRSPLEALESIAEVTTECLVIETHTDLNSIATPALAYYPGASFGADDTNYFGPNLAFIIEVLKECGFVQFDTVSSDYTRLTVHAWKDAARRVKTRAPPPAISSRLRRAAHRVWSGCFG